MVDYLKVLSQNSSRWTEKNHECLSEQLVFRPRNEPGLPDTGHKRYRLGHTVLAQIILRIRAENLTFVGVARLEDT
jgi:hypothetical protein